jgi:hypothetical protein
MLKIKGFHKIVGETFSIDGGLGKGSTTMDYVVERIDEYKNFYDFIIMNKTTSYTAVVGLHRHSKRKWEGKDSYDLLWNGIDGRVSVTTEYIKDMEKMITALRSVIDNNRF